MVETESMGTVAETSPTQLCDQCDHDWAAHRLCGYGSPPTEGWIECPVEGCTCKGTWSLPPDVADQVKALARE
jgi:hypothetical protein